MLSQKSSSRVPRAQHRVRKNSLQLWQIRRKAGDMKFVKGAQSAIDGRGKRVRRVRLADNLGEHRIKLRWRRVAQIAAGIDPNARPGGFLVAGQGASAGRDN